MKSLAAVNGNHFTEANGFTLVSISWGSDPLFVHSKFLTNFCFFLYHKSTDRKTIITALLLVSFLLIRALFFFFFSGF